jgi:hypothetical protein
MNNNFIFLLLLLAINTAFAFNKTMEHPVNGGIKIIDFYTNFSTPKAYFYDIPVLVQKVRENHFQAVVGIPHGARIGTHSITIQDFSTRTIDFSIHQAHYDTQYITLTGKKKKFVDLNKKQINRVITEKKLLQQAKQIFSKQLLFDTFITPTVGIKTGVFGSQRFFNNKPRKPHSGIDYANNIGTDINAFSSGEVILTGDFYFNGGTIFIDHGQGFISVYVHLNEILVQIGDKVTTGETIATMGASGRATGPHLHFGIYLNQVAVNPELLYAK